MDRLQRHLQRQMTINILLYSGVLLLVGGVSYSTGLYLAASATEGNHPLVSTVLKDLSLVVIAASIVTILFGWATKAESVTMISSILANTLDKALKPTINYISRTSVKHFRWDTWIGPSDMDGSNYLYQIVNLSYQIDEVDTELRAIFAVGNKDGVLKDYFDDERYVVKYKIECQNEELDVMNDNVCKIHDIKINNCSLPSKAINKLTVNGCKAKEYIFEVPERFKVAPVIVSITYSILKWSPGDRRVYIAKQIFEPTEDSEFRISVASSLNIQNIVIDTTEISSLSHKLNATSSIGKSDDQKDIFGIVICKSHILPGSAIRFELQRSEL